MSHRPEDNYSYVATEDIFSGSVRAFAIGDPIPDDTVEELGLLDSGQACHRDDYERPDGEKAEPTQAMKRGEMPAHLQDSMSPSADTGSSRTKTATTSKAKAAEKADA